MEEELLRREQSEASTLPPAMPAEEGDASLVAAVLRKDRKATADFVARFADDIYGYVYARLAPRYDQVDDLVQEVFLAAWKSLPNYRGDGPLRAWIGGIARHKVEDFYRDCLRTPESLDQDDENSAKVEPSFDLRETMQREDVRTETLRVLEALPEHYRMALIWRYWERCSARDMAHKTGKSEKAIERLLARARTEFRQRWDSGRSR